MSSRHTAEPLPAGNPGNLGSVHVVVNPMSGSAGNPDAVADHFRRAGATEVVVSPTTADDPGLGQARDALRAGATLVVACGGDGTVRACAAALAGSETPLAVIPAGTGNLLARNLQIPLDRDQALAVATMGCVRRIDVGEANGETFTVMAGIGFDAKMIRDADRSLKSRIGSLAYVTSALRHLRERPSAVRVQVERPASTADIGGPATMVLVGNLGSLVGGLTAFPDADPGNGSLELAVMNASSLRAWLRVLVTLASGGSASTRHVRRSRAERLTIYCQPPEPWELDGEDRPAVDTLTIHVRPDALLVCVPATEETPNRSETPS